MLTPTTEATTEAMRDTVPGLTVASMVATEVTGVMAMVALAEDTTTAKCVFNSSRDC